MKKLDDISNVLIVGAGTLGLRIALRCAMDGFNTKMYDINQKQLDIALETQTYLKKAFLKRGVIDQDMIARAEQNLQITNDLNHACENIDLVSESIIENLDVKKEFYADFTPRLDDGVILTTNTSYIMPSQLLDSIRQPDHFCALHFHDVFTQTIVDVMPHPGTALWVNDLLMEFGRKIHHVPVFIKKENPGYIFNYMLMAIIGQAGNLAVRDIGSIQDIDRSFMVNFGTEAGPFGMLDQVGLDTALHIVSARKDHKSVVFAEYLKTNYVDKGKLGFKTREGFYSYPGPEYAKPDFLKP